MKKLEYFSDGGFSSLSLGGVEIDNSLRKNTYFKDRKRRRRRIANFRLRKKSRDVFGI